jgi:mannose-6-phosphate isomerase-like protein (cupin superfamily)
LTIVHTGAFSVSLIPAETAPRFEMHGAQFTGLAAPSRGARESAVWRVRLAAGTTPVTHRLTREEVFVALSGTARVTLDGETFDFPGGAALIVPADTDFALSNAIEEPFEAVVVLPVGGMAQVGDAAPFTPPWAA